MPKKKKRSTLQRKPSLIFIESPVHVQRNVPSPVFCARHPPTANAVPVDHINHLSWVSPQFRPSMGSTGRHCAARKRRKSIACLRNINKENHASDFRHTNLKYNCLRFVNDPSINTTETEDVHITGDSDTSQDEVNDNERKKIDDQRKTFEKVTKQTILLKTNQEEMMNNDVGEVPCSNTVESHVLSDIEHGKLDSFPINTSSKIDFTQVCKRQPSGAPVKRLFATQLDANPAQNFSAIESGNEKEVCSETEQETISESESGVETSPPHRWSLRLRLLKSLLQATPDPPKVGKVLAPDTPEEEYGWPLRKRQLRNYKQNRKLGRL